MEDDLDDLKESVDDLEDDLDDLKDEVKRRIKAKTPKSEILGR
jgi:transcription initiation factor IIE alpha subunit